MQIYIWEGELQSLKKNYQRLKQERPLFQKDFQQLRKQDFLLEPPIPSRPSGAQAGTSSPLEVGNIEGRWSEILLEAFNKSS